MLINLYKKSIFLKKGKLPGKTVAIFAGVHGNEKAGIIALKKIIKKVKILKGSVYFVFANPDAIKKNVRQIDKNLNRCFFKHNKGKTNEDKRARKLMKILDKCDALLDIHASNTKKSTPFIICEKEGFDLASKMDFNIVSYGWNEIEPGATDGYLSQNNKIALCLECGSVTETRSNVLIAEKSMYQFLQYFESIENKIKDNSNKQKFIYVFKAVHKKTTNMYFAKDFYDFQELKHGEIIAYDGKVKYIAKKDQIIIFPNSNKKIGEEIFILGKNVKNPILTVPNF